MYLNCKISRDEVSCAYFDTSDATMCIIGKKSLLILQGKHASIPGRRFTFLQLISSR
uniref:Uncharacterized protein n=1 Tax=Arundo donax TaxID=35708 RepID=A0A0A8XSM1_ARUDO